MAFACFRWKDVVDPSIFDRVEERPAQTPAFSAIQQARQDYIDRVRSGAAELTASSQNAASSHAAGSHERHAEDEIQKRARISSDAWLNAVMCGDHLRPGGRVEKHPKACRWQLASGQPCHHHLWEDRVELAAHIKRFLAYSQEVRSSTVFSLLQHAYFADCDEHGMPVGAPYFHYVVHGRAVCCQCTFDRCCGSHSWCTQMCTHQ